MVTKAKEQSAVDVAEVEVAEAGQEVVKAGSQEIVADDGDDFDWMKDAGAGLEHADKDSFAIPFLRVVQKMSPIVDEGNSAYNKDAKPGMFLNTVNGKLYDGKEGVIFLPVSYQRRFLCWGARGAEGASFKGEFMPEVIDDMLQRGEIKELDGRLYKPLPDGTIDPKRCDRYSDTRSFFIIQLEPDGTTTKALMALTSTQIKKAKKLCSMLDSAIINGVKPPSWLSIIKATTAPESNDQGSWSGVNFVAEGYLNNKGQYKAARDFYLSIESGEAKVDYAKVDDEGEAGKGGF